MELKKHWTIIFNVYTEHEPEFEFQCEEEHEDCFNPYCYQYKFKLDFNSKLNVHKEISYNHFNNSVILRHGYSQPPMSIKNQILNNDKQ